MPSPKILATLAVLTLFGCKNRIEKYGEQFSEVMKTHQGLFRGAHLGDSMEKVQEIEDVAVDENTDSLSLILQVGGSGECTVTYGFESQKLYEINAEAEFENLSDGKKLVGGFKEYFNEMYGPCETEKGKLVWKVRKNGPDYGATIEMVDENELEDFGFWHLIIYRQINPEITPDSMLNS